MVPLRDTVTEIIRQVARDKILPRFNNLGKNDVAAKQGPQDLVTVADVEAEQRLAAELVPLLAGSRVVGEEKAETDPASLDALQDASPVWVIDPVDGTLNFVHGKARFCVIVALVKGGQTVEGWIHAPVEDFTAWAARGRGAWIGGEKLRVAKSVPFDEMTGSLGFRLAKRTKERQLQGELTPKRIVRPGCIGLDYVDLARGGIDFSHYGPRLKPWDHAAGVLLHKEAGGFSAIVESRSGYAPNGGVQDGVSLLMVPDATRWLEVKEGLGL